MALIKIKEGGASFPAHVPYLRKFILGLKVVGMRNMITGIEWVVVAAVIIVLLLWGPSQLPKIARAFGEAKKEFQKATKEAEEVAGELKETVRPITETVESTASELKKVDDKLLEVAKTLGINTEGKTRDQIAEEILKRTKKS